MTTQFVLINDLCVLAYAHVLKIMFIKSEEFILVFKNPIKIISEFSMVWKNNC